jgi:predicted amidohydrolase YtcJ
MPAQDRTHGKPTAELIFTGGHVHTVNARNDIVEAIAVSGGRRDAIDRGLVAGGLRARGDPAAGHLDS